MLRHSLSLIATFEVAARHQSFVRAAEELNVTPAAISQQVRLLEERLGLELFTRKARGLLLTPAGRDYAQEVRAGLTTIQSASQLLCAPRATGILRVATFHSFGLFWLLPRLPEFRARYPEMDIRLVLGNAPASLSSGEADLAIRFGTRPDDGCVSQDLIRDTAIAVASPDLLAGRPPFRDRASLQTIPLLHDDAVAEGEQALRWSDWLGKKPVSEQSHTLPDGLSVLHACLLGQGVALARASLVSTLLRSGRLVRVLGEERQLSLPYRLVSLPGDRRERVKVFSQWVTHAIRMPG
nr:LysR substrate-binding domain-containing protein [Acetobacter persici]